MSQIKKPAKVFFFLAPLVLFWRRLTEAIGAQKAFQKDGFEFFENGAFVRAESSQALISGINSLLDQIEAGRLNDSQLHKASGESETFSYEFINENTFYQEKLGYRLRVSYNINEFETWPELAQKIIASDNYKDFLKRTYGTVNGVHKCYIEKTFLGGPQPQWHVDCLARMARLVYLLSDVDADSAPLEYIQESQLDSNLNFKEIKERHLNSAESWTPYDNVHGGIKVKQFTGTAGTSYMFDARGVHRASPAKSKCRYILMVSFTPNTLLNRFLELNRGGWPAGTRSLL